MAFSRRLDLSRDYIPRGTFMDVMYRCAEVSDGQPAGTGAALRFTNSSGDGGEGEGGGGGGRRRLSTSPHRCSAGVIWDGGKAEVLGVLQLW